MSDKQPHNENESHTKQKATQLLLATQKGNKEAVNQLLPLVYDEISRIAHQKLRFERSGHTLDTTALVHEAYFRLINHDQVVWQSRAHFLAMASLAMKQILINYARQRKTIKRGGTYSKVELGEIADDPKNMSEAMADDILALNEALGRMEEFNQRGCKVVEYHFFGGLTWKEISEVMGLAPISVRRAWYAGRLWLRRELEESASSNFLVKKRE